MLRIRLLVVYYLFICLFIVRCGQCCQGFDDGVSTVWGKVGMHDSIKKLYNEEGKDRKLYLTGHSLGAALATNAAARLAFGDNIDITAMYTIGSPK